MRGASILWLLLLFADATEARPVAAQTDPTVEEVTVTARRRVEPLVQAPVAVTLIEPADLAAIEATRLDDIDVLVPNLEISGARSGAGGVILLRGVGQANSDIAFDPGVGLYIDGVYLSRAAGNLPHLFDLEDIEVLRGPQGTLFGRNTVGGAIRIQTRRPQPEREAILQLRGGSLGSFRGVATLNTPVPVSWLSDRLFLRWNVAGEAYPGYTENHETNETWSNYDFIATRTALRWLATNHVTVDVSGEWSREHGRGRGSRCVYVQPPPDPGVGFVLGLNYPTYADECRQSRPYDFEADSQGIADIEVYGTWVNVESDLGSIGPIDDLVLTALSSWQEQVPRVRQDLDGTALPIAQLAGAGGGQFDGEPGFQRQVSEEVDLAGTAMEERVHLLSGLYTFWEQAESNDVLQNLRGVPLADLNNGTTGIDTHIDNWSVALFGHSSFELTDWASLSSGVRWTYDHRRYRKKTTNPFGRDLPSTPVDERVVVDVDDSKDYGAVTPTASFSLLAPETWLRPIAARQLVGYFTYARGFKGGGFFTASPTLTHADQFEPETIDSYEIGLKGEGNLWGLKAALFLEKYDDIQVESLEIVSGGPLPMFARRIRNAAAATIRGLELESSLMPFAGLRLHSSLGLLDTKYDEFPDSQDTLTGQPRDRSGERFDLVPRFQGRVTAEYGWSVDPGIEWGRGDVSPQVTVYRQNSVHYAGEELSQATQGAYVLVDARLAYRFYGDQVELALWGRNLTDRAYFDQVLPLASSYGTITRTYAEPRTFGGDVALRF